MKNKHQTARGGLLKSSLLIYIFIAIVLMSSGIKFTSSAISNDNRIADLVPRIDAPIFDGQISSDWEDALHLDGVFHIPDRYDNDHFNEIDWELSLGHDDEWLYIAIRVISPGVNPWSDENHTYPDLLTIYFNMDRPDLTFPEDGKLVEFFLLRNPEGTDWGGIITMFDDLYFDPLTNHSYYRGSFHYHWWYDCSLYPHGGLNEEAEPIELDGWRSSLDQQGNFTVEYSIPMTSADKYDGFNLDHNSIYNFGICLEYARQSNDGEEFLLDQWPGEGWSPWTAENSELFHRLTIDLSVDGNSQPWADFSYSPAVPISSEVIEFQDESYDVDGHIVSYLWDFGDGHSSTEQNPSFIYHQPGYHDVQLTVTDDSGLTDTIVKSVFVNSSPPIANFTFTPSSPTVGETIHFTDLSTDDVGVVEWEWWFGEGGVSTDKNPSYAFQKAGRYNVTLYVTDGDGLESSKRLSIDVKDRPDESAVFDPLFLIVSLIGIALFLGVAFFWRKRTRSKPDSQSRREGLSKRDPSGSRRKRK